MSNMSTQFYIPAFKYLISPQFFLYGSQLDLSFRFDLVLFLLFFLSYSFICLFFALHFHSSFTLEHISWNPLVDSSRNSRNCQLQLCPWAVFVFLGVAEVCSLHEAPCSALWLFISPSLCAYATYFTYWVVKSQTSSFSWQGSRIFWLDQQEARGKWVRIQLEKQDSPFCIFSVFSFILLYYFLCTGTVCLQYYVQYHCALMSQVERKDMLWLIKR